MIQCGDRLVAIDGSNRVWIVVTYECTLGTLGQHRISGGTARYLPHGTTYDFKCYPDENFIRLFHNEGRSYIVVKHYDQWETALLSATKEFHADQSR